MTLNETIIHEKEVAEKIYIEAMLCHANPDDGKLDDCIDQGRYHEQLVKWLENYKRLSSETEQDIYERAYKDGYDKGSSDGHFFGYNEAINDFVSKLKQEYPLLENGFFTINNDFYKNISKIANELIKI